MKRLITALVSGFLLLFYIGIILYVFLAILRINVDINFGSALTFEIIGFLFLCYFILNNILIQRIKTGFFVPLILTTTIYTLLLNITNIVCITMIPHTLFILLNLSLLFLYCLLSVPMYIMGRR